jgi:hypothetical protein
LNDFDVTDMDEMEVESQSDIQRKETLISLAGGAFNEVECIFGVRIIGDDNILEALPHYQ